MAKAKSSKTKKPKQPLKAPKKPAAKKPAPKLPPEAVHAEPKARPRAAVISASSSVAFTLERLSPAHDLQVIAEDARKELVGPPDWLAVVPTPPSSRRYLYLLLLREPKRPNDFMILQMIDGAGAARLPAAHGWIRPVIRGHLHLISSDLLLTRSEIASLFDGHQGGATPAKPPYT